MNTPLEGKRILVTRPKGQASALADQLSELGAIPVQLPAIEIAPPLDYLDVDQALANLAQFDWVVFTSINGVAAVAGRMKELSIDPVWICSRKVAVIGPATAQACAAAFREPDLVPKEYVSEGISAEIDKVDGQRFLLLRADIARKDLACDLRKKGGEVSEVAVYRIVSDEDSRLAENEPAPDYITLTSSASALATAAKLRESGREHWMRRVPIACIGPITAKTVQDLGYKVAVGASEYTIPGLVSAIVEHSQRGVHA